MKFLKFIVFFSVLSIFSQNKKIDSLELVLENHIKKDTIYVNLLNKIAAEIYPNNNDKIIKLVGESIFLSDSLLFLKGEAEAYYLKGKVETTQLKLEISEKSIKKAQNLFKKLGNDLGIAKSLTQIGVIYYYKADYEKALEYYYKSIEVNKSSKDNIILANAYINIGLILNYKGNPKKALEFNNKSLEIYRKLKNNKYIGIALNNIGIIYIDNKEYKKALDVYEECLSISKIDNNKYLVGYVSNNLALLYKEKKEYKKSLSLYTKALKIHQETKDNSGICNVYNGIGDLYIELKEFDKALMYIKKSEKIAVKYKLLRHQLDINNFFSKIYQAKNKYKKALEYYIAYKKDYDSINSLEVNNRLTDLETKYNFKKKELLAKEKEIQLNQKIDQTNEKLNKTKRQILYGLILVLFLFVVLGFVVYNARIKRLSSEYQKVVLKQKLLRSQMKPHFIFNSLSVLQGIVLQKEYAKASLYISKFSRLLREILEASKEDTINLESEIRFISNSIFVRNISNEYSNCTHKITVDDKIDIKNTYIPPMIVQPIVENAFEHGFIELNTVYKLTIDFKLENGKLICTVIDNGEGLNANKNNKQIVKKKSFSSSIIKERLELFSKKYGEEYSFKVIDRTLKGDKGTKVILLLPYKIGHND